MSMLTAVVALNPRVPALLGESDTPGLGDDDVRLTDDMEGRRLLDGEVTLERGRDWRRKEAADYDGDY